MFIMGCETSQIVTPEDNTRQRPRVFSDSSRTPSNSKEPVLSTARTEKRKDEAIDESK